MISDSVLDSLKGKSSKIKPVAGVLLGVRCMPWLIPGLIIEYSYIHF